MIKLTSIIPDPNKIYSTYKKKNGNYYTEKFDVLYVTKGDIELYNDYVESNGKIELL